MKRTKGTFFKDFSIVPHSVTADGKMRSTSLFTFWDTVYPKFICFSSPVPLHGILKPFSGGGEG